MNLKFSGGLEGGYLYGSGLVKANGNISMDATSTSTSNWALYFKDSRLIQSTAGNISIKANGGYGFYMNAGGIVAGNDTTAPTAGGSIDVRSVTTGSHIAGAGLRLDGDYTKILAYGDININANAASAGLTTNGNGHGVILYGHYQTIRSFSGDLTITGYANRPVGTDTGWANISGGITLWSGLDTLRAYRNVTLKGVSMQGIGVYLTVTDLGSIDGVKSDTGNILIDGLSNSAYAGTYVRIPVTATAGYVSISGAGSGAGIYQDSAQGNVTADGNISMVGYATAGHGIYYGVGGVTSSNGNVTLSGYSSSSNAGYYGIYSNARSVSAANGSVIFQGAKIASASSGSGYLVNAAQNITGGVPDPIYATADAGNPVFAASKGIYWSGAISANTSSGYIQINAKAPDISGNMTAYGLVLQGNNQSYSLTGVGSITALAASLGTGSLTYSNSGPLTIGSYGGISGITAGTVNLTAAGLQGSNNISTTGGTITFNPASGSYEYSGVITGGVALSKSGTGTQVLSGASSFTGATSITGGVLRVTNSGGLGSSAGATTISSGAALEISGGITLGDALTISGTGISSSGAVRSLAGVNILSGNITLAAASEIQVDAGSLSITPSAGNAFTGAYGLTVQSDGNLTIGGVIATGVGSLTKTGSADLYLTDNNTFTGSTTISGGTLYLGNGSAAGTVAGAIVNNASLVVNRSNDLTLSGVISGNGSLTKLGAGTLTLSGTNAYTGVTTVTGGILQVSSDANLGAAPGTFSAAQIVLNGGGLSSTETFALNANRGITLGADTTISVATGKTLTYSGVMTDGASAYGLTKTGGGTLALGADQTYEGMTTVSAGTLRMGANAALNGGSGALNLATGATLDIQSNALTLGSLTMAGTAAIVNGSGASSLTVSGSAMLANSITTSGHQVYNGAVTLAEDTNLVTTANGSITFNSTLNSANAASPKNLSANISSSTYYWVDWTSVDNVAKTVTGSVTIDGTVVTVTYNNPQGWYGVQTSGGTNYWTGNTGTPSPYVSSLVANGPTTTDIIQLAYAGKQTLTFSESVENLAFSVVSLNGNGYGFNQDFAITSYTGYNGAGSGYFGTGTLSKTYDSTTQQYKLLGTSGEPHGTIRFVNSVSSLAWTSLSNETWNGFTVGVNSTTSTIGKLVLNGVAGGNAALGNITSNSGLRTTAEIASAQSVAVTKTSQIGASINTTAAQTYTGDTSLIANAALSGTAINLGKVNLSSNGLTINNSAASQITGLVSGSGSLTKQGSGTLTLSGANTYSGGTTVSAGQLLVDVSTVGAAGSITSSAVGTGGVTVASGAAINVAGYSLANDLNLSGVGVSSSGALYNSTSTPVTLSGAITLGGDAVIKGNAADLTISGAVNGAHALTVSTTNKAITQSGIIGASAAPTSVTMDAGTGNVILSAAQTVAGPLSMFGGTISISNDLTVSANADLKLVASKDIVASAGVDLSTQGGNILLSANSDGSAGGGILMTGVTVRSNGGNITLGGGSDGSGYAEGSADGVVGQRYRGVWLDQSTIDASGSNANGNVAIRGRGWQGADWVSPAAGDYAIGVDVVTNAIIKTGGTGTVLIDGVGGKNNNSASHGVGINLYNGAKIYTDSGAITLTGAAGTGLAREHAGILMDGGNTASIYSTSGDISLTGSGASTDQGIKFNGGVNLGWSGSSGNTMGAITLNADAMTLGAGLSLKTSGMLTVQSVGTSFRSALDWPLSNLNIGTTLGGLTLGKTTNTANITISSAQTVNGPVNIYGGTLAINAPITTSSGTVTLKGSGNVVDGAGGYLVADKLLLLGGAVNLDHASTSINTLAGSGLTGLTLVNAGAFNVGTVGTTTGLASTGAVALTATTGAMSINQNISSGSANQTLQSAVTLGADVTLTGGTVTFGAAVNGARALMVTGNAAFNGEVGSATALSGLSVSGTTTLGASVRTTGLQTYTGAVTLGADATLTGSAVHLDSTVNGAAALTIAGDAVLGGAVGGVTRLGSLSVSGTTSLAANVSTTGAQTYTGGMTLTGSRTLAGSGLSLGCEWGGWFDSLWRRDIDLAGQQHLQRRYRGLQRRAESGQQHSVGHVFG
jgi:autotransporter-associated beta strand protein